MIYEYIIGKKNNPYYNLAFEETLIEEANEERVIVYLWQNDNTIVIGRNQDPYAECKVEEFQKTGGSIARRKSGGGTVYHDMGNLCFSIISHENNEIFCDYRMMILRILEKNGLNATYNGRNDLVLEGKKFSGNAVYNKGKYVCQHGTILIHTDIEKMNYYITPNLEKLNRNGVKSVSSRVINLCEVKHDITCEGFCQEFISTFKMIPFSKEINEEKVLEKMKKYESHEWIYEGRIK